MLLYDRLRQLRMGAVLVCLLVVDHQVAGDPQQPGDERYATRLVTRDGLERFEEGLCGYVFRQLLIAGEEVGVAVDSERVTFIQKAKGLTIATFGAHDELVLIGL